MTANHRPLNSSRPAARRHLFALLCLLLVPAGLSCSTTPVLSASAAADQVSDALEAEVGRAPEEVTCPDDLDAEVGNEMRCTLVDSGESYGVTVRITSVEGDTAEFDIEVDEEPS